MKSKTIWIIVGIVVLILVIGYFTNWFGMKKSTTAIGASNVVSRLISSVSSKATISCPSGCTLVSSGNTGGQITLTCSCKDGSQTAPIITQ